jgi:hypothetical protein
LESLSISFISYFETDIKPSIPSYSYLQKYIRRKFALLCFADCS